MANVISTKIPATSLTASSNTATLQRPERKPDWLKVRLPSGQQSSEVFKNIKEHGLHTICQSGNCPNQAECWGEGTATLMILGNVCTRSCRFCNVVTGKPQDVDILEPRRVAESVKQMGLKHVVITSVDRDDLVDVVLVSHALHLEERGIMCHARSGSFLEEVLFANAYPEHIVPR